MMGVMFSFNVFLQLGLHYTALHAGLSFVPWSLGIALGSALAGAWLGPKYGRRCMQAGMIVVMGGLAALWWTFHTAGTGTTTWDVTPATLAAGIGSGMIFAPMFDIILAGVRDREVGSASGVLNAFQQFGGAIAVAVVGSAFFMLVPRDGFTLTMEKLTVLCIALYLVSLACTFLLPRMPRREGEPESAGPDSLGDEDRRPLEQQVAV
jgi:MFS family permease